MVHTNTKAFIDMTILVTVFRLEKFQLLAVKFDNGAVKFACLSLCNVVHKETIVLR